MTVKILGGDCRAVLTTLSDASVQCCVTSPPYYGLRDYGVDGQIGLEQSPAEYVAQLVAVFAEVRRVMRDDGTLWLNLGDSYANGGRATRDMDMKSAGRGMSSRPLDGAKPKDLLGVPWRVAFALQADGWYLRSDIIWAKPNPMPESVTDRPTSAHEHVFLFSKRPNYFYDGAAIRQPLAEASLLRLGQDVASQTGSSRAHAGGKTNGTMKAVRFGGDKGQGDHGSGSRRASGNEWEGSDGANARNVWTIPTQPYRGAHFATMPPELAERCIKAGSAKGDTVLDPFGGAGTTGLVADRLGRNAILVELNPEYAGIAGSRIQGDSPLFAEVTA